jgi:hypothetical protein
MTRSGVVEWWRSGVIEGANGGGEGGGLGLTGLDWV